MKQEDFLRLVLKEVHRCDEAKINSHFKEFKKRFRKYTKIMELLEAKVTDRTGTAINDEEVYTLIDQLKKNKSEQPEEFLKFVAYHLVKTTGLYVQEIRTQIGFANYCFKQYLKAKEKRDVKRIFMHIHHFVVHASNIDKILQELSDPSESLQAMFIRESFDLDNIDLKQLRSLRNHLEHFEERLSTWIYLYFDGPILDMNLIDGGTKGLIEEQCLRLLDCDKDKFILLGEKFDLLELRRQITMLEEKINRSK